MNFRLFLLSFLILPASAFGQLFLRPVADTTVRQGIRYHAELGGLISTGTRTPFWLRSNQFGMVPLESPSGILVAGATGQWGDVRQSRKPTFKASVELAANGNRNSRLILPEAYVAVRLGHGELYVGRRKEVNGITDTLLTSGSYAWSGNAVPATQIRLGTRDYAPLKFTNGVVSVNAFFSHGWFANSDSMQNVYLHAKALYVRIGKPTWKVRFYGGMSHYVQWGGYSKYLDNRFSQNGHLASGWDAFKKALWPSTVEGSSSGSFSKFDSLNRSGNHLGSIDLALDLQLKGSNLLFYIQRPWEDMSGVVFGNFPDGLYGVRWRNQHPIQGSFRIDQVTAEFFTTMDQSGTKLPKGADDYFDNYQYLDGWTHRQRVIGSPFLTRWMDSDPRRYSLDPGRWRQMISNNRLQLMHVGLSGRFASGLSLQMMLSYSRNYGRPLRPEPIEAYSQFSGLVNVVIPSLLPKNTLVKVSLSVDKGTWLPSTLGGMIVISKNGWF